MSRFRQLRHLSPEAFFLAGRLGTLNVATRGAPAWIITDPRGICAEARRFDGAMYILKGSPIKGFALPGSKKHWIIGTRNAIT